MTVTQRTLAKRATTRRVRVRAFALQERVPPAEIQFWDLGDNPTDYGMHRWTQRSAADVMARYDARGNPLLIDVEHNGALVDGEPAVTGGYARLELRAGAPWLVFDWSAYGAEQIATGQRRFLSGEYDVDRTTGEILALYRVSLVADPGTHRARMLAAAKQEKRMDPTLAAIMAILGSVSDPAAAIDSIKSLVSTLSGGDAAGGDDDAADGTDAGDGAGAELAAAPGDATCGDAPADDKSKDDKDKVAAAAKPAPLAKTGAKPAPAPSLAAVADTSAVDKVAASAVQQVSNAQRDHLIATQGDRLDPSIRRWASSQPLAVVSGLLHAAPAKLSPPGAVVATQGATQGEPAKPKGLEGRELDELKQNMGTFKAATPEVPHVTPAGVFVLPTVTPSAFRERKRVEAAALAAGKAGK